MAIDTTQRGLQQSTEHGKRNAHEREKRERERGQDRELSKPKDKTTPPSQAQRIRRRKPFRDANSLVGTLGRSETRPDIGLKIANLVGLLWDPPAYKKTYTSLK
jgi:hypothetical protein